VVEDLRGRALYLNGDRLAAYNEATESNLEGLGADMCFELLLNSDMRKVARSLSTICTWLLADPDHWFVLVWRGRSTRGPGQVRSHRLSGLFLCAFFSSHARAVRLGVTLGRDFFGHTYTRKYIHIHIQLHM
jgi:hypothetical protein